MQTNFLETAKNNLQFVLVCIAVVAVLVGLAKLLEETVLKKNVTKLSKTNYLTVCAMFGALALILFFFEFPLPFLAPGFYKLDFSEVPVMIGAFYLGPLGGVIIELVKVLLKLVLKGTTTAFVGDLANFVVGCSFVVPASVIYHWKKSRRTALAGLVTGTAVLVVFGTLFNALYLLPAFAQMYLMSMEEIVALGTVINGNIHTVTDLVMFAVAPLNLIKGLLISVLTMLLYKRISGFLHNALREKQGKPF